MNGPTIPEKHHHLIYGTLNDCLTGDELMDTDDERIRQSLAQMMMEEKGFKKEQLRARATIETLFAKNFVRSTIDLVVSIEGQEIMILRYGPGSLVSRERAAVAAARVLNKEYRLPLAVVTNGKDAELIDTVSGKILGYGMDAIPTLETLNELLKDLSFLQPPDENHREKELRILNAFDVERCCL